MPPLEKQWNRKPAPALRLRARRRAAQSANSICADKEAATVDPGRAGRGAAPHRCRENAPRIVVGGHHAINGLSLTRRNGTFDEVERIESLGMLADVRSEQQQAVVARRHNSRQLSPVAAEVFPETLQTIRCTDL